MGGNGRMTFLKKHCVFLLVILLLGVCLSAQDNPILTSGTDRIVASNGDHIDGVLESADGSKVTMTLKAGAKVTIPWENVRQVVLENKVRVKSTSATSGKCQIFDSSPATIEVVNNSLLIGGKVDGPIDLKNIDAIASGTDREKLKCVTSVWAGTIAPSASLSLGTQGQQQIGGAIDLKRTRDAKAPDWHHQELFLDFDASNMLSTQVGNPSIRSHVYDGTVKYDVYVAKNLYVEGAAFGNHNSELNLYLEQAYGGGFGGFIERPRQRLELAGDLLFIGEHFYGTVPGVSFAGASLFENYSVNLIKTNAGFVNINETGIYLPAFNQTKAWQARGNASLNIPLSKKFTAAFSYRDDYMENAPGVKKNWSTIKTLTFAYNF
jgi:hypothetical protein